MSAWGTAKLADLVTLTGGAPFRSSDFGVQGIPVLKIKNVKPNRLLLDDVDYIPEQVASEFPESFLKKGDLLITMTGNRMGGGMNSWVGKVALFTEEKQYCLNQRVGIIRPKPTKAVDIRFLSFFLSTEYAQREFVQIATGSGGQANLSPRQVLSVDVPHPPLGEQRAIAGVLGALDDKIELNRRMNETLEALAKAEFGRMSKEGGDSVPFADTIEILGGGTPKTSVAEYWDGNIPWFSVTDAPSDSDVFVIDTDKKITRAGIENSSTQVLPVGTTIISARGTVGKVALVGMPMAMNQSCYGLQGKAGKHGYYTYFQTRAAVGMLQQHAHGSVFDTITRDTLAGVEVAAMPPAIVEDFEEKVAPLMKRILNNLFESRTLAALRDALLPKLLSGEVRVKETA